MLDGFLKWKLRGLRDSLGLEEGDAGKGKRIPVREPRVVATAEKGWENTGLHQRGVGYTG